jgi:hypothetical protein
MLPAELVARNVADTSALPDYPYRDGALLVWQAIHQRVEGYVALDHARDAAVADDSELAAWAATPGNWPGQPATPAAAGRRHEPAVGLVAGAELAPRPGRLRWQITILGRRAGPHPRLARIGPDIHRTDAHSLMCATFTRTGNPEVPTSAWLRSNW